MELSVLWFIVGCIAIFSHALAYCAGYFLAFRQAVNAIDEVEATFDAHKKHREAMLKAHRDAMAEQRRADSTNISPPNARVRDKYVEILFADEPMPRPRQEG